MNVRITEVSVTERIAAYEDGKIISRLYIRDRKDGKHVYLFRLKTNKSHRRLQYATALIKEAIEKYKDRGIFLRASGQKDSLSSTQLIKIHKKFGFKRRGKTKMMYLDPPKVYKVGDKTKLKCPNCNCRMRVAKLSYTTTSVGAYDAVSYGTSYTDNGRTCKKCGLDFVPGWCIELNGFITEKWESLENLKQWIKDVNEGRGKNIYSRR